MEWTCEEQQGSIVARPMGRVDESSVEAFSAQLDGCVSKAEEAGASQLILSLAGIEYMSSRGLRSLTLAKRRADAAAIAIILAEPNEMMQEILAISRYDKLFRVTGSVADAV